MLITLASMIYTFTCGDMTNEGVIVWFAIMIFFAVLQLIAYGIILVLWLNGKLEKKYAEILERSE